MKSKEVKKAAAFQRGGNIFMHPYSETTQGFWIFSDPVLVVRDTDPAIASQLLDALSKSAKNVTHPTSWKGLTAPLLRAAGVRSFDAFTKSAKGVDVCLEGDCIMFTPTSNGGPKKAFLHLNHKVIRCRATEAEVTGALRAAFDACERE